MFYIDVQCLLDNKVRNLCISLLLHSKFVFFCDACLFYFVDKSLQIHFTWHGNSICNRVTVSQPKSHPPPLTPKKSRMDISGHSSQILNLKKKGKRQGSYAHLNKSHTYGWGGINPKSYKHLN